MKKTQIVNAVLILLTTTVFAQNIEQEKITVLPFSGWQGSNSRTRSEYQNILTDKIVTRIIKSHRFSVVDRSHLQTIIKEQNLQLSGIIDESTAVRIGGLIGVDKFILGSFTRNSTEYHKAEYYEGKKTKDAYYTAEINATIKLLDVETAMYIEAIESKGSGRGSDARNALLDALDRVAANVIVGFEKYFRIQAFITKIDKSVVYLDRGISLGINEGQSFEVYDININDITGRKLTIGADYSKVGKLKIVFAESQSSKGRLFGDFSKVQVGNLIRETKEDIKVEAIILEKSFGDVVINVGADLGLSEGSTFDVIKKLKELKDPTTGEIYGIKTKNIGKVYLYEVGPSFARGKIIKGRYTIKEGMRIQETTRLLPNIGISASFGIKTTVAEPNNTVGEYIVTNDYTGSHEIAIDYSQNDQIETSTLLRFSSYARYLNNNYTMDVGVDIFNISDDVSGWAIDGMVSKHLGILPEFIYVTPSLGLGIGMASQDLPGNIVSRLSDGNDKSLSSLSLYFVGKLGARITLGRFVLFGDASYSSINFSEWDYSVKTGEKDENDVEETEFITINNELVPYPEIAMPITINVGFAFEF